ncbi:MAG: division/cell wall cluster transcriptional repressor MraZ [Deltaproteobacteria bacterium]|nr:division/cell wall cluster transcriptional repressor MraZ [Deltaproteobacteria bacterium]
MFRGCFEHSIDDKGRVSIPVSFRKVLLGLQDERIVVTKFLLHSFRCLDIYPQAEWEVLEQELLNKPRFDETFAKLEAFYLSNAQECAVDKQGRILLPPMLREYASLQKDVVFASALKKFRVWDKAIWERFNQESEKDLVQNPQLFAGLNM